MSDTPIRTPFFCIAASQSAPARGPVQRNGARSSVIDTSFARWASAALAWPCSPDPRRWRRSSRPIACRHLPLHSRGWRTQRQHRSCYQAPHGLHLLLKSSPSVEPETAGACRTSRIRAAVVFIGERPYSQAGTAAPQWLESSHAIIDTSITRTRIGRPCSSSTMMTRREAFGSSPCFAVRDRRPFNPNACCGLDADSNRIERRDVAGDEQ